MRTTDVSEADQLDRRIVVGFSLIVGAALLIFGVIEILFGEPMIAAVDVVAAGVLCAIGFSAQVGMRVDRTRFAFIATVLATGIAIVVVSGGQSVGVVIAIPCFIFLFTLMEKRKNALLYGLSALGIIGLSALMPRWYSGDVSMDTEWLLGSFYRTPLIVSVIVWVAAEVYRRAIETQQARVHEHRIRLREAAEKAHLEHQRFADFLSAAADGYWETNEHHHFSYVSPSHDKSARKQHALASITPAGDLLRSLKSQRPLREHIVRVDEQTYRLSGQPRFGDGGEFKGFRGVMVDCSEELALQEALRIEANHDALTGLLKRQSFMEILESSLERARALELPLALAYIDLDKFKPINDRLGHAVGDRALKATGRVLAAAAGTAGRMGGDEFCVVLTDVIEGESLVAWAEGVIDKLKATPMEGGVVLSASIGIIRELPVRTFRPESWVRRADTAMYAAKQRTDRSIVVDVLGP